MWLCAAAMSLLRREGVPPTALEWVVVACAGLAVLVMLCGVVLGLVAVCTGSLRRRRPADAAIRHEQS